MSARIILHPRCAVEGPAFAAVAACLQERGISLEGLGAYPFGTHGAAELVRKVAEAGTLVTYERWDGARFDRPRPAPSGDAA